jgi:hypothetical protein
MSAAVKRRAVVTEPTDLERARSGFADLESWAMSAGALKLSLNDVERETDVRGREVLRRLLQAHMHQRGPGDVGPALIVAEGKGPSKEIRRHGQRRHHRRNVLTIFGALVLQRLAYHAAEAASVHPLDEQAELPERSFSYEVQRRTVVGMIQGPYDEAVERVHEWTGLTISKKSAEEILQDAARDFDPFYEGRNRSVPSPSKTGLILVAGVDCKGVPMVYEDDLRVVTRGKNERDNKKRMATVAAVFTQEPRVRTPEEVVESLFRRRGPTLLPKDDEAPRWPGPEHKRVWASLLKTKDEVFAEVVHEVNQRDPKTTKIRVVLTDGERALQLRAARELKGSTHVLDLMHALQRLWTCANCFHPTGSAAAEGLTKAWTLELLRGKVSQVVKGIRCSATKQQLSPELREEIRIATAYLLKNKHRMKYDEYLRRGLPIASGSVEGACKNIINDRMERSGMRWALDTKSATSEPMLRMRAVYLSGDFDEYWAFHLRKERDRLYPKGRWQVTAK